MSKVAVITDSNSCITQYQAKEIGVTVIPMPFSIGGNTYYEDVNLTREEFFQMQANDEDIKTSMPSPAAVMETWEKALETHDQVIYIPMSSGLSGSCQAARMFAEDYDGKVEVVNNQRISVTQRASVLDAIALAEKGWNAQQIREELERVKFDASIYIMLDTLKYLKKGGRVTPAAAAIGSLLRIKPVLQIQGERLDAFSKARTEKQGKNVMINAMKHDIETRLGGIDTETCHLYAVHANVPEAFATYKQEVCDAFPNFGVEDGMLSLSICCHIGPGALAIACSKKLTES